MKKKVVVGMSGGVDSSVAAYLLKEQGYDVIGVTMQIWQEKEAKVELSSTSCCGITAVDDARRVANQIGIPYYVMNFREDFQKNVIDYFISEYEKGRTPNPCIACNRYVKWESLLTKSISIGAEYIATGHYARVITLPNGRYTLKQAATIKKDQTYALYNLTQHQLEHTLMPVGDYDKDKVREIASNANLQVAHKPDSQDICFVEDGDYAGFIEKETGKESIPGNFVDLNGTVIGRHKGILHYTIGQRKGLNLPMGHPVFVVDICPLTNEIVIGENEDVFAKGLIAENPNFMAVEELVGEERVMAKVRYNHKGASCRIRMNEKNQVECIFDEPVRAVTKGQAVVFYKEDYIYGGATIEGRL